MAERTQFPDRPVDGTNPSLARLRPAETKPFFEVPPDSRPAGVAERTQSPQRSGRNEPTFEVPPMRASVACCLLGWTVWGSGARAEDLPIVPGVPAQPLAAQARRLVEALELVGQPLPLPARARLDEALGQVDPEARSRAIQAVLDPLCLFGITINPEGRVGVVRGPAPAALGQHEWRVFLARVQNEAGRRPCSTPPARTPRPSSGSRRTKPGPDRA